MKITIRIARRASVFGAALVLAITIAPVAYAQSEQQIKSDCELNAGGHYSTYVRNGRRISQCCYKDIKGKMNCDYYVNGNYDGTQEWNAPPPPPPPESPGPVNELPPDAPEPPPPAPPLPGGVNQGPPIMVNHP